MILVREKPVGELTGESGIGLVEILVAMFLFSIVAIAMLPGLIQGMELSQAASIVGSASELTSQQLEDARAQTSCAAITPTDYTMTDAHGVVLHVVRTVGTCPVSGYPLSVPVTAKVTRTDTGTVAASASTSVFVTAP